METAKPVSNLLVYDPAFQGVADRFVKDMGGDSAAEKITSMAELEAAVHTYTNVKFLEVCLHGKPGMIDFSNRGGMTGAYLGTMAHGTQFLARDARVLFDSCNIGEGTVGDAFMDELGKRLFLGKGGTLGATTVANVVPLPLSDFFGVVFMKPLSFGRLKVRRYDVSGQKIAEQTVDRHGILR